jgi:transposase
MKYGRYPIELKKSMVSRFLLDPEAQIGEFSRENGIPESCLRDWIRQSENGTLETMSSKKYVKTWSLSDKFEALQKFDNLDEIERGKWLRKNGVTAARLDQFRHEIKESLNSLSKEPSKKDLNKIKALEKELARKESALAEASALLFAKKKLDAFFGDQVEEE